ncbi:MAG: aminotransferase class III-fold pyridoxal phosphate-dependent enzyme, partial [Actinomycetota bacterium]|nr:aminotransferase class III-fold pyridoxal phosphate-dependent enzyme [Actinomycetota bacterium]
VIVPPEGYLRRARELCDEHLVLLIADEIQSGLGRTGRTFACEHEGVTPDVYVVGKALGGGIVPISAVVSNRDVLGVFRPGEHGSTFGGNPLACTIGIEVLRLLITGEYQRRSDELGTALIERLRAEAPAGAVSEVRGKGLWVGIELTPEAAPARAVCERLMEMGVLAKDTHETTVRLAPPLCITQEDLEWATERILTALAERLG